MTYATILTIAFIYVINILVNIQAATYGFEQTNWNSGASTTSIALHDYDQDGYDKYYSKDDNIVLLNNGEDISLLNASSTISETSTSDFDAGNFSGSDLGFIESNSIKMYTFPVHCNETYFISSNYYGCYNGLKSPTDCHAWYQGYFGTDYSYMPDLTFAQELTSTACGGEQLHTNLIRYSYNISNSAYGSGGTGCKTYTYINPYGCYWVLSK